MRRSIVAACLLLTLGAFAQSEPNVLLEQARHKQLVEGDLEGAIRIYRRVVAEHSSNRAAAARALVEIGRSYEKLGKQQAREAYETVIRDFGDQTAHVNEARERLAALTKPSAAPDVHGLTARRIWSGPRVDRLAVPFPDGRALACTDWETGDLAIYDVESGQLKRLTNKGSWFESTEFAMSPIPSPDGKQIAYGWFRSDLTWDLRVIRADGSATRILYQNPDSWYAQAVAWTPDGKGILTVFYRMDGTGDLAIVSASNGARQVVTNLDSSTQSIRFSFSPDGKSIAFDRQVPGGTERDIAVVSLDSKKETLLVGDPGNDFGPIWSADGKEVFFISDRASAHGLWSIAVANGKAVGKPRLIKPDMGRIFPVGLTEKEAFVYGLEIGESDLYEADLDSDKPSLASPRRLTNRFLGSNDEGDWSSDGRAVCYVSRRTALTGDFGSAMLVIRDETGREREIQPRMLRFDSPRWLPDGSAIVVSGRDHQNKRGIYAVDPASGDVQPLVRVDPPKYTSGLAIAPDGKTVYFGRSDDASKEFSVVAFDLARQAEQVLFESQMPVVIFGSLGLSPDGSMLAMRVFNQSDGTTVLRVLPTAGGEPRDVVKVSKPLQIAMSVLAFTRNGKLLLYGRSDGYKPEDPTTTLWAVPVAGGDPIDLGFKMDRIRQPRVSPDGKRLLFAAGVVSSEIWMMENFRTREPDKDVATPRKR